MKTITDISQSLQGKIERFDQCNNLATYFETHCLGPNYKSHNNHIAAIHNDTFITRYALNDKANIVARNILRTFQYDKLSNKLYTGILLDEGFERLIAILACLKLGLTIVPLAADRNMEPLKQIINKCQLSIIIHKSFPSIDFVVSGSNIKTMAIDTLMENSNNNIDTSNLLINEYIIPHSAENTAIVLNTSGSSGTPKTISLTNSQLFNRLFWQWRHLPYKPNEVVCHRTGFLFVDNIVECLSCLLSSTTMVIVSPTESCDIVRLSEIIEKNSVTWILTVPSLLQKWINQIETRSDILGSLYNLSTVISSGEMLFPSTARRFFKIFRTNKCRLVNLYGSTEVCGDVSSQILNDIYDVNNHSKNEFLSVGQPISNNQILLSSNCNSEGEVIVIGKNVSPTCGCAFPTGDIGFIDNNNLYICGRVDDMVKINGKRFFTKDITLAIMLHPEIENCFTIQLRLKGKCQLVSFFTTTNKLININKIKSEISDMLTKKAWSICLPKLEHLETIPVQSQSMKPDKKKLCSIAFQMISNEQGEKTKLTCQRNVTKFPLDCQELNINEEKSDDENQQRNSVYEILAKNLDMYSGDLKDSMNFYDIGGDSLITVICIADLNRKGFNCTTEVFFYNHTIKDIVNEVIRQSSPNFQRAPDGPSLKCEIKKNFVIENIDYQDKAEVIQFLIENFYTKELVVRYLKTSVQVFADIVSNIFDAAVRSGCSFSLKDANTKAIIAIQLSEDSSYDFSDANQYFSVDEENVLECFLQHCKPKMSEYLKTPKLNVAIVALCNSLKKSSVIQLLYFMEKHTINLARCKNYKTIETTNTSQITKKLCNELNYKIIKSTSLETFLTESQLHFPDSSGIPDVFGHYMILHL